MEVEVEGQPLPRLRSKKGMWALALLALKHGRSVQRSWLAGTLWPDSLDEQALANLRLTLTDLRGALGSEAVRLQSPTPQTLCLDLADAEVDLVCFDRLVSSTGLEELRRAVEIRRGPLLDGCGEEWVLLERENREQQYLTALETAARLSAEARDPATSARFLKMAVTADPFRESAHRELMRRLAESGDHAAVTAAYRDLRALLRSELNTEPSEETAALYHQLRQGARERAASHSSPSAGALAPEQQRPSAETEESDGARLNNLPLQTTSFIGRRREIDEIKRLLVDARIVTLTGAGGTGKTRLSIQAASELLSDFIDGVCLVEHEALTDAAMVEREVAVAMGLREEPGKAAIELVESFLRNRKVLLVLDNCEHLLEACARLAARLLKHCADLRILATSREALGISGEYTYRVPTLQVPPPRYLPPTGQACEYEAVRLFVDRAKLGNPGFEINDQNARDIMRICQTLDGIPLAIELAAARAKSLPVEQIAARLDDCFRIVTGGNRTALPRHQTLRALIDWSYDLLPESEKVLFRRLSAFAGGWTLEAAENICACSVLNCDNILDLLGSLTDRSLVVFEPESGSSRYRFLEPIRQYAHGLLAESGELESVIQSHLEWFLDLARAADLKVWGPDGPDIMKRLEDDHDNIRAAMERGRERGCTDALLQFGGALMHFWYGKGYWGEGREWLEHALESSVGRRTHAHARALWAAAVMAWDLDEYRTAETRLGEAISILEELGDDPEFSYQHALIVLGSVKAALGEYEEARIMLEKVRALQVRLGDDWNLAWTAYYQAFLEFSMGNIGEARRQAEESLVNSRAVGHRWALPRAINLLGILSAIEGDPEEALSKARESAALQEVNGDRRGSVLSRLTIAYARYCQSNYEEATRLAAECLRLFADLSDRDGTCLALETLGRSALKMGDPPRAVRLYSAADGIRKSIGITRPEVFRREIEADLMTARSLMDPMDYERERARTDARTIEDALRIAAI